MSRRSIFRAGRIAHVRKGMAYHLVNSIRGLRAAKRARKRGADRDIRITQDGVIVVCHWARPCVKDGFYDPLGRIGRHRTVESLTWAEVKRLRTRKGGYRINRLHDDLRECGRLGIVAYLEPKGNDPRWHNVAIWRGIKAYADQHNATVRGYALRANKAAVPYMNQAGIPSKVLSH